MDRYLDAVLLHIREAAQGEAGYEVVTPVIVCNPDAFASVKTVDAGSVQAGDDLLTLEKK